MSTVNPTKHLTNLDEWRRLGEANIFPPDSRLELIEGEILEMAPIGFNHAGHLKRINMLFMRIYALHGIPEYWLLNLIDNCLEVYRRPHGELYEEKTTLRTGDSITLSQVPDIAIKLSDIL